MRERARRFRKNMTKEENKMWYYLRNRRLNGYKFVRECTIGSYIADFVCRSKKIIVEIDGGQHNQDKAIEYDRERTEFLKKEGYRVIRFWNSDVRLNIKGALEAILAQLEAVHE
jgi:very-short-patch-repair endonuclease